jgi:hypothetical protein
VSNPLNDSNKPPVSNGNPTNAPAQGSITDPFRPSALPPLRHAALDRGRAGNAPIVTPVFPQPGSTPKQRDTGTNPRSR